MTVRIVLLRDPDGEQVTKADISRVIDEEWPEEQVVMLSRHDFEDVLGHVLPESREHQVA